MIPRLEIAFHTGRRYRRVARPRRSGGGGFGVARRAGDDLGELAAGDVVVGAEVRAVGGGDARLERAAAGVAADDAPARQPLDPQPEGAAVGTSSKVCWAPGTASPKPADCGTISPTCPRVTLVPGR